jgi:hypothetical protein
MIASMMSKEEGYGNDRPKKKQRTDKFEKHCKFDKNKHKPITFRSYSNNEWYAQWRTRIKAKVKALRDAKKAISRKTSSVMSNHYGKDSCKEEPQQAATSLEEMEEITKDEGSGGHFGRRAHMSKKQQSLDQWLVSISQRHQVTSLLDDRELDGKSKANRSELDSHANTCCAGANTTPFAYSKETISISPFIDKYPLMKDIKIASVVTMFDDHVTGDSIFLVIHEAL